MVEYRREDGTVSDGPTYVERRRGSGGLIFGILVLLAIIVAILFATGFFKANVTDSGALPTVKVDATGGALPTVDFESKKVVVGSKETSVDVPTVQTKKTTIDVPVVGVSDGKK